LFKPFTRYSGNKTISDQTNEQTGHRVQPKNITPLRTLSEGKGIHTAEKLDTETNNVAIVQKNKKQQQQETTYPRLGAQMDAVFRHHMTVDTRPWDNCFLRSVRCFLILHTKANVHSFRREYPPARHRDFTLRSPGGSFKTN